MSRDRVQAFVERHDRRLLAAILFVAFAVRALVLRDLAGTIYDRQLAPDEHTYHRWASALATGSETPEVGSDFPRLPAAIFGFVYRLFGADAWNARLFNLVLGVAICGVMYQVGRSLYGTAAGLIAALLSAFSTSLVLYSVTALPTCVGLFVFSVSWALGISVFLGSARHRVLRVLALGAACGVLVNLRGNAAALALLLVPAIIARYWAEEARMTRVLSASGALVAVFAVSYLLAALATGSPSGARSGFNFYIGNNSGNDTPYFQPVHFTSSTPEQQAIGFTVEASRRLHQKVSQAEAEKFWIESVLTGWLREPARTLERFGLKAIAIFHQSPTDNNIDPRMVRRDVPWLSVGILPTWVLLALGVAGALLLPFDARLVAGAAAFTMYALTVIAFFAGERLRTPLLIIVIPYASTAIWRLAFDRSSMTLRAVVRASIALAVLVLVAHRPIPGGDDLSGAYNMRGLMLFADGDFKGAEHWYSKSLALDGQDSPAARIGLAAILQLRGRLDDAVRVLQAMPDNHHEVASKYEWLGNLALARARPSEAVQAYEASLAVDSSKVNAYRGIHIAYRLMGQKAEAAAAKARLQAALDTQTP